MHEQEHFQIGDRIRTRHMVSIFPPKTPGTIVEVFHSAPGFYEVCFDATKVRYITYGSDLQLLVREVGTATTQR